MKRKPIVVKKKPVVRVAPRKPVKKVPRDPAYKIPFKDRLPGGLPIRSTDIRP